MLNRSTLLAILNSMSDDNLVTALKATGVELGHENTDGLDLGEEQTEGLQSWNARPVTIPDSPRPPLVDKAQFTRPQPKPDAVKQAFYAQFQKPHQDDVGDFAGLQQDHDGNMMPGP